MCIYVNKELKSTMLDVVATKHDGVEAVCKQVQYRKLPSVLLCCMYRHARAPSTSFNFIEDTQSTDCSQRSFFHDRDLNDNFLSPSSKLSRTVTTNKLTQVIDKPTRVPPTSATLLDVVITNMPNIISDSYVIPGVVADHDLIGVSVDIGKPKRQPVTKTKRDIRNYSSEILCTHISNETPKLNQILHTDDVNKQVLLQDSINQCAPLTSVTLRRPLHLGSTVKWKRLS